MGHLNTGPGETDATASAFIMRTDGPERRLLLHKHRILKKWMQFGGHVERRQHLWQALADEVLEEAGYGIKQLTLIQPLLRIKQLSGVVLHPVPLASYAHPFLGHNIDVVHFHDDTAFGFLTDQQPIRRPAADESQELQLFTEDELANLPNDAIPPSVREIGLFLLQTSLDEWVKVPASDFSRLDP